MKGGRVGVEMIFFDEIKYFINISRLLLKYSISDGKHTKVAMK